jgi:hypothetical protein
LPSKRYLAVLLVAAVCLAISCNTSVDAAPHIAQMSAREAMALREVQQAKSLILIGNPQSLHELKSTISGMETAFDLYAFTPKNLIDQRRTMVRDWAQILKLIERVYDPTYDSSDPADMPTDCVTPPDGQLCGADPSTIKDPNERAMCILEIRANDAKYKQTLYYHEIMTIDQEAMATLESSLNLLAICEPKGTPSDFVALDKIVEDAGLSEGTRITLDSRFYTGSEPLR